MPQANQTSKYLEKLAPENSVLVMIDYLTGLLPGMKTIAPDVYQKNVTALARVAQIFNHRMPTIILGDEGGFRGKFLVQLSEYLPDAPRVSRHTPSGWGSPEFQILIERENRPKVILAGISLDNCVMQTALDLLKAGYEVYVLPDVSGADVVLVEQAAMSRLVQAGAVMTNWVSLASELMNDWETPEGREIGELYQKYSSWGSN